MMMLMWAMIRFRWERAAWVLIGRVLRVWTHWSAILLLILLKRLESHQLVHVPKGLDSNRT